MDNTSDNSTPPKDYKEERTTVSGSQHEHKPHKSILKKSREPARKKRIVWDEQNIALTEREKCSTMKIDEPKTPYHYYDSSEDDEEMAATRARELEAAVGKMATFTENPLSPNFPFLPHTTSDDSESSGKESGVEWAESDESGKEESAESRKHFNEKRKNHYNEYEMMKKLREKLKLKMKTQQDEEDEEDEMEGDENEDEDTHPTRTFTTTTTTTTTSTAPTDLHIELPHKSTHSHNHNHNHTHFSSKTNHDTNKDTTKTNNNMDDSD
eukprot:Phypoly_transcript_12311.p1 GENE.Phypoly_transcript_12311~~Phypoly_transcript_12311.p1  ORF type:complete len:268 (+),score=61.57 Phypoly_transcript_12311:34-837(+)